jgi:acyl carrier protein
LSELGAEVTLAACDVGEREQLATLLDAVPAEHPLGAVFHCAAGFDNGLVEALSPERLATAMGPKADAAWHLHELTREVDGCELVLVSSIAGSFENPGQANYAAANAFLDALAQQRDAAGLAARAIAFGPWRGEGGDGRLNEADRTRLSRAGFVELIPGRGLELLDRCRRLAAPFAVAAPLDEGVLRSLARAGTLPALLRSLVRVPARRAGRGSLAQRLAGLSEAEREEATLDLVRGHIAAILGHPDATAIDPEAPFKDLGFDSLAAVDLRNRLGEACGLRLPATLVFDHPSATAVSEFLRSRLGGEAAGADGAERKLEEIAAILGSIDVAERGRAAARLQPLLAAMSAAGRGDGQAREIDLEAASDAEIFELLDSELGGTER